MVFPKNIIYMQYAVLLTWRDRQLSYIKLHTLESYTYNKF